MCYIHYLNRKINADEQSSDSIINIYIFREHSSVPIMFLT